MKNFLLAFLLCTFLLLGVGETQPVTTYTDFATAIATVGATQKTLFISSAYTLSSNITVPSTLQLYFLRGGSITLGNYNLIINGQLEAGEFQIFFYTGSGRVTLNNPIYHVYYQWWNSDSYATAAAAGLTNYLLYLSTGIIPHGVTVTAPSNASYLTATSESGLSAEINLGALSTGLLKGTVTGGVSTLSSITDSSSNWDTAYIDRFKWDGGATGLVAATGRTSLGLSSIDSPTFSGLSLGLGSLTLTGSIATTGARVTKGWFTDLEITNAPTINGAAWTTILQPLDATLTALAGLTIADISIIEGTGVDTFNVVTSGGNNYILGSNAGNTALEFKTPANVLSQIGGQTSDADLTSIAGISVARGSLITGQGGTPAWAGLTVGVAGKGLISDGTDIGWADILSSVPTGLTYTTATRALSLTTGYMIPGGGTAGQALISGVASAPSFADILSSVPTGLTYTGSTRALSLTTDYFIPSTSWVGQTAITTLGTIGTGSWHATTIAEDHGGTGVAQAAGHTITVAGPFSTVGHYTLELTTTDNTAVTFPTTGTLVNSAVATLSSLTSVGSIGTGSWHATTIDADHGGTGVANAADHTITLAGPLSTVGHYTLEFTTSNNTAVTLPTTGTLVNTAVTTLSSLVSIGSISTGSWHATVIDADHGGTGQTVYAVGDLLYASTTTALSKLADVATGAYLSSGGVGVAPAWATLNQAAVAGLTTASSPVFATVKLSGLTDGYIPKHTSDATGLENSVIYTDGTNVSIGTAEPLSPLNVKTTNTDVYSGTNSATWDSSVTLSQNAASTGYSNLISFGNPSNVNSVFGVVQNASGYGDFIFAGYNGSFAERMRINSSGNVGIGTVALVSKLDVGIATAQTSAGVFSNSTLNLYNPTNIGAYSQMTFGYTGGGLTKAAAYLGYVSTDQSSGGFGDLVFGTRSVNTDTAPTERVRIQSDGNVGIGYTDPETYKLKVNGTGYFSSTLTANSFAKIGGTSAQYLLANGDVTTSAGAVYKGVVDGDDGKYNGGGTALIDGTGTTGEYYACNDAGTYDYGNPNGNSITLAIGDQLYYSGTVWLKIPGAGSYTLPIATATLGGVITNGNVSVNATTGGMTVLTNANLTGNVTSSGNATTIASGVVTYAMIQNVSATNRVLGRATAGAGSVEELSTIPSTVLGGSSLYVGTTAIALNRTTAEQALDGITSVDRSTAATLSIGGTNANAVNLSKTGVVTTIKGTLNVDEAVTFDTTLGVTGVATLTAQPILSSLTASQAVFTDGSKGLVSNAITGTGNVVMSTSPTLITPTLGVALATSINGNTITTGTGTLTLGAGSTLATSATNSITLTSTGATNVTLPTTGTLATLAGAETLTGKVSYNGLVITANTGAITTGEWFGTVIDEVYGGTGVAQAAGHTITVAGPFSTVGHYSLALTASDNTNVTLPTTGTLATLAGIETFTNKTLTSPKLNEDVAVTTTATKLNYLTSATGTTGTASTNLVFSTSPVITTPDLRTTVYVGDGLYSWEHTPMLGVEGILEVDGIGYFDSSLTVVGAITGATSTNTINGLIINSGALSGITTASMSGQLTSTVTTGTPPFVVASITNVANLNASSLSGATFASPGAIGSGTPSTGVFTTISVPKLINLTSNGIVKTSGGDGTLGVEVAQRGDIITGQGASPVWTRLGKGADNTYPRSDGTDIVYKAFPYYDVDNYNFTPQAPGGSLTGGVLATVTLTPCPLGVIDRINDTSTTESDHYVYISAGTGTAEAVRITGGTCTSGLATGTIKFTPINSHSGAWTVSSATAGIQEAHGVLTLNGGALFIPPGRHTIYASISLRKEGVRVLGSSYTYADLVQGGYAGPTPNYGSQIYIANSSNLDAIFRIVNCLGCQIENLDLHGNRTSQSGGEGYAIASITYTTTPNAGSTRYSRIRNLSIFSMYGGAFKSKGIATPANYGFTSVNSGGALDDTGILENISARDLGNHGLYLIGLNDYEFKSLNMGGMNGADFDMVYTDWSGRLKFIGGVYDFSSRYIFNINTHSTDIDITNVSIDSGYAHGIYIYGGDSASTSKNIRIIGNSIHDSGNGVHGLYDGIYISGYVKGLQIIGNFIGNRNSSVTDQAPGGSLTGGIEATVTLTPCPSGILNHYLYLSGGTGSAEAVLITGGTCTSDGATGTVVFTPINSHTGVWTAKSGNTKNGIQFSGSNIHDVVITANNFVFGDKSNIVSEIAGNIPSTSRHLGNIQGWATDITFANNYGLNSRNAANDSTKSLIFMNASDTITVGYSPPGAIVLGSNLIWDNASKKLGIGITPSYSLDIKDGQIRSLWTGDQEFSIDATPFTYAGVYPYGSPWWYKAANSIKVQSATTYPSSAQGMRYGTHIAVKDSDDNVYLDGTYSPDMVGLGISVVGSGNSQTHNIGALSMNVHAKVDGIYATGFPNDAILIGGNVYGYGTGMVAGFEIHVGNPVTASNVSASMLGGQFVLEPNKGDITYSSGVEVVNASTHSPQYTIGNILNASGAFNNGINMSGATLTWAGIIMPGSASGNVGSRIMYDMTGGSYDYTEYDKVNNRFYFMINSGSVGYIGSAGFTGGGAGLTGLTAGNLSGTIPSSVLGNSTVYIGSTAVALNRSTGNLTLTGITSIDGNAATATTASGLSGNPSVTVNSITTSTGTPVNVINLAASTPSNAAITMGAGLQGTFIAYDPNDYTLYDRTANQFKFVIGGTVVFCINSSGGHNGLCP